MENRLVVPASRHPKRGFGSVVIDLSRWPPVATTATLVMRAKGEAGLAGEARSMRGKCIRNMMWHPGLPRPVQIDLHATPWRVDKPENEYDRFTVAFTRRLPDNIDWVLVSGYPALLLGRTRNTEDIDLIVDSLDEPAFRDLWRTLDGRFVCLQTSDPGVAFHEYLQTGIAIRFARPDTIEPNMEFKVCKNDVERYAIEHRKEVLLNDQPLWISPLELQIAFKLYLGGDKDLEDARHLFEVSRPILELEELSRWIDLLAIPDDVVTKARLEVEP